ncbi:hydrophobin 3 [Ustilago sp. UG-2017a]|nr:hydrophobin 3 [Ustilago sp. UG-2017a]
MQLAMFELMLQKTRAKRHTRPARRCRLQLSASQPLILESAVGGSDGHLRVTLNTLSEMPIVPGFPAQSICDCMEVTLSRLELLALSPTVQLSSAQLSSAQHSLPCSLLSTRSSVSPPTPAPRRFFLHRHSVHVDALTGTAEHIAPTKRDGSLDPSAFLGQSLSGVSVLVGNKDLLQSLAKRWAEEEDAAMAKRAPSVNGRGQRPRPRNASEHNNNGQCSVGRAQCCSQIINDEGKKKTLAGLLGFNSIAGDIGLNCQQIPILGISAQSICKASPVCCTNVVQDGLVNIGCTSIPIN